jgi:putative tryptophan/tyrosine transport system substrate-binding protein
MSYGPDPREAARKIAVYIDKILKGAKPSDLPIEQMSRQELIIDLRVARAMGIQVPQDLLLRADEVLR